MRWKREIRNKRVIAVPMFSRGFRLSSSAMPNCTSHPTRTYILHTCFIIGGFLCMPLLVVRGHTCLLNLTQQAELSRHVGVAADDVSRAPDWSTPPPLSGHVRACVRLSSPSSLAHRKKKQEMPSSFLVVRCRSQEGGEKRRSRPPVCVVRERGVGRNRSIRPRLAALPSRGGCDHPHVCTENVLGTTICIAM